MRRISIALAAILFFASYALAQRTVVSGTVKDVNGIPYAGATLQATLSLPVGVGGATLNGVQIGGATQRVTLDNTGSFLMQLPDNAIVLPGGTQWTFAVNISPGAPPPLGTGPQNCSVTLTITGASQSVTGNFSACPALGITNAISPTQNIIYAVNYGAVFNTKIAYGRSSTIAINNGSPIVTCNNCNFSIVDTAKLFAATNGGQGNGAISTSTQGAIQVPRGTSILSVQSATQVTLTANATATCTTGCLIAWGSDDTVALQNAWNALTALPYCGTLVLPVGNAFTKKGQFNTVPVIPCSTIFTDMGGPAIVGQGKSSSLLIPSSDFDFTDPSCKLFGGTNYCFAAGAGQLRDWGIYGLFDSYNGTSHANSVIVGPGAILSTGNNATAFYSVINFAAQDFDGGDAGTNTGLQMPGGSIVNSDFLGLGANSCRFVASAVALQVSYTNCGNSISQCVINTGGLNTYHNTYGQVLSTAACMQNVGGVWSIWGDSLYSPAPGSSNNGFYVNGGTVRMHDFGYAPGGASCILYGLVSGIFMDTAAQVYADDSCIAGTTNAINRSAGTFFDKGGNTYVGVFTSIAPTCPTVTGAGATGSCAAVSGSTNEKGTLRVTVAGAGPAALGTVSMTFAGTFAGASGTTPSCTFTPALTGGGAWNARATAFLSTRSTTVPVVTWDNNAAALTATTWDIDYVCVPR